MANIIQTVLDDTGPRDGDSDGENGRVYLQDKIWGAIRTAGILGYVVTVTLEPVPGEPLAMRNYRHVVHVRRAR